MLLPKDVVNEVQAAVPNVFNMSHFVAAWKRLNVRPARGAANPEHTNPDWCTYMEPTKTYLYTRAYVNYLIKKCSSPEGFEEITGSKPRPLT